MTRATAPGKIILFGEHAVVYGRPAIAVPVFQVRAEAIVEATPGAAVLIDAPDIGRQYPLDNARIEDPLAAIVRSTCRHVNVAPLGFSVTIRSTVPVARGLGSGAAVSVAIARAIAEFFQRMLNKDELAELAYAVEKLHHGTPSGIDNTVIAFEQPVFYVRGEPIQSFRVARPFLILIADTGVRAPTKVSVGDVRRAWESERARYEKLFDEIGAVARSARTCIEQGQVEKLGALMNENQLLLRQINVSSPEVDRLVETSVREGALGAKLSGGGRGGNIIALVEQEKANVVAASLTQAGAAKVIATRIE